MKLHKSMIGLISLLVGLIVYYLLAVLAILSYPGGFDLYNDLWTHLRWLGYNPDGALFFRIGNVIYALSLVVFFLSASGWITFATEKKRTMYLIQAIGISIAVSMIIGELLADQALIFVIASGVSLLLIVVILVGISVSMYTTPGFWRVLILLFIISIAMSLYLLYMGVIDAPIQDFRIIDLLVTAFNQASICAIALNMAKTETT